MYKVRRALGNPKSNNAKRIWRKYLMLIMSLMVKLTNLAEEAVIIFKTIFSQFWIALIITLVMNLSTHQVMKELPSNPERLVVKRGDSPKRSKEAWVRPLIWKSGKWILKGWKSWVRTKKYYLDPILSEINKSSRSWYLTLRRRMSSEENKECNIFQQWTLMSNKANRLFQRNLRQKYWVKELFHCLTPSKIDMLVKWS